MYFWKCQIFDSIFVKLLGQVQTWSWLCHGRPPLIADNLWCKTKFFGSWEITFDGRSRFMGDDLWWKTTLDGREPLREEDHWWRPRSQNFFRTQNFFWTLNFFYTNSFSHPKFFFYTKFFFYPKCFSNRRYILDPKYF